MEQQQLHSMEPLWNHWYVEELLGEGSFGSVYRIKREDFGEVQYAALKVIGVPQTKQQVRQCFAEGLNEEEVWQYFGHMVEEVYQEITLMAQLKGKTNIVSYEDHEIRKRTEGIGYDILIRMELLTSLEEYLSQYSMTREEVIHMGKDLCQALCVCGRHNIIHRDIKPANIFISRDGDFKLGDFGIARTMQECPKDLSIKGSYTYMAPEVYLGSIYDKRVDIYSLGIVLYTYLNQKNIPFIQEHITYENKTKAIKRRLGGEKIPRLSNVPEILADVIEKAVAYSPEERFLIPEEFLMALQNVEDSLGKSEKKEILWDRTMILGSNDTEEYDKEEEVEPKEKNSETKIELQKEKNGWKRCYIHMITVVLFLLFGGSIIFAGIEGFGSISLSSNAFQKKNEFVSVYATTPKPTPTPILERKTIEENNQNIKSIQEILTKNKCKSEELGELYLSKNQLTDIKELTAAKNLKILDISYNQIKEGSSLSNLQQLRICNLTGNPVNNLSWLEGKKKLTSLWIGSTDVEKIEQIRDLKSLQDLHIENTQIADLTPLRNCQKLKQIDCRNCKKLMDITPLLELKELEFVSLDHTSVSKEEVERLYQHMKKENPNAYLIDVDGSEYTG